MTKLSSKPALEPCGSSLEIKGGFVYFRMFHRDAPKHLQTPMSPQTARDLAASLYDYAESADLARARGRCLLHDKLLVNYECEICEKKGL